MHRHDNFFSIYYDVDSIGWSKWLSMLPTVSQVTDREMYFIVKCTKYTISNIY